MKSGSLEPKKSFSKSWRGRSKYGLVILLACAFLISFTVLTFEITLTRIYSLKYSYHYTFLAVSLSLAGLGLGGILANSLILKSDQSKNQDDAIGRFALTFTILSLSISFLPVVAATNPNPNVIANAGLIVLPFFTAGIFLAACYRFLAVYGNLVYFADLLGAAIGSLAAIALLSHYDAVNVVLVIGLSSSVGSVLLAASSRRKRTIGFAAVAFLTIASSTQYFHANRFLEVQIADQNKHLSNILRDPYLGAEIVDSRWNAFGRTDMVEIREDPGYRGIFIDGGSLTKMYRFDGNFSDQDGEVSSLRHSVAYFPFYFANKEEVLVIGAGGGADVLIALMAGANHITAVEVNPETVNIVRDYSDYNGGIYTEYDNIHVFIDEGRSFLKRSPKKYDVIMLNLPVTQTSQGTSGYSLAENYLFTTDAFNDYLNHLEDDGNLVIVAHDHLEIHRLAAIALETLQKGNVPEIFRHIVVTGNRQHPHYSVFILKKTVFVREETMEMYSKAHELGFWPHYFPFIDSEEMCSHLASLANEEVTLSKLVSLLPYDIRPPTDDKPFFFKFEKELPETLTQLLAGSLIVCILVLFAYNTTRRSLIATVTKYPWHRRSHIRKLATFMPYYFSFLGIGFMLVEVSLIQKFILFLGHPTSAISVSLFSLLLSSGIGSLYSKRWRAESLRPALKASLAVGVLVVLYTVTLNPMLGMFLGFDSTVRFVISFILLFPLGFIMGIPFPVGIRIMEAKVKEGIVWMWSLNGVYSLLGSVLAVAIAMSLGFNAALFSAALLYSVIFLIGNFKLTK